MFKSIITSIVTLLICIVNMGIAQTPKKNVLTYSSPKMLVTYNQYIGHNNDSNYIKLYRGSLFLTDKSSVYIYYTTSADEHMNRLAKSVDDEKIRAFILKEVEKDPSLTWRFAEIFTKDYDEMGFLKFVKFGNKYYWLPDSIDFKWRLLQEFKEIDGYRCQKAIGQSHGAEVVAWFTPEIPISTRPYYISGLPGLVLEYRNLSSNSYFKAVQITSENIPPQEFKTWLDGEIITRAESDKLQEENRKTFENMQRMMQKGKVNQERNEW